MEVGLLSYLLQKPSGFIAFTGLSMGLYPIQIGPLDGVKVGVFGR